MVGTGSAIAATGNVGITGSLTGTFETTTNASAAGGGVAVGASVSVSVISEGLAVAVARSIGTVAGSLSVTAASTIVDVTDATASSSGESKSDSQASSGGKSGADQQAGNQLGNSDTNGASLPSDSSASGQPSSASGTSGGEGGSGGGVGVAASVAVSVLTVNNIAAVTDGADLAATGAVKVEASAGISDTTQAIGTSISIPKGQSSSTEVGVGVAVGVVNATNEAVVGSGSSITGHGTTIEAITPGTDTFIVWGVAAAGGTGDASIAGSVAVNVVNTDMSEAYAASSSSLTSSAGITVQSTNNVNIQSLAASGAFSDGTSVGAGFVVAILNVDSDGHIAGNASATGAVSVAGNISLVPTALSVPKIPTPLPATTSVAVAGAAGTGSAAVAATVIVDLFTLDAAAYIGANSVVKAGSLSVTSKNTTTITTVAGALAATTGAAGIGISLDLEIIKKQAFAQIDSGAKVTIGGTGSATVQATSSETMLSAVVTVGVGDDVGFAGTASIAVTTTDTEATVGDGVDLLAGGTVNISAGSTFFTTMIAGGVGAAGTAGIGAANTTLVHTATTLGTIGADDTVTAGGAGLSVGASESENLLTITAGIGVGGTVGIAGSATVNVLKETTTAGIGSGSSVTLTAGSVAVNASDMTTVISVAGDLAASGTVGAGVGVDVGVYTKTTSAYIGTGATVNVPGDVQVTAETGENLISVVAGVAAAQVAVGINAGVHVFNLTTQAYIDGDVFADGSVAVAANDASDINEIVGVLTIGEVSVAAGADVDVFTKTTSAYIGAGASVTALGQGSGLMVDTGQISASFGAASNGFTPSTKRSGSQSQGNSQGQGIDASSTSTLDNAANGNHSAFDSEGTVGTPNVSGMDLTGSGSSQSVDNMSPSLTGNRTTSVGTEGGFEGVAVAATDQEEIRTFTVALSGGVVGVAISAGVEVDKATTQAYIGANAAVNTGAGIAGAGQTVLVGASDDFYHLSVGAGIAVGAVAVAPAVGVNLLTDTTTAAIDNGATVNAVNDIAVEATGSENIVMIGLGIAGGGVGIGGVVDVLDINNNTDASIGTAAIAHAGGTVFVEATDTTGVLQLSGALGVGALGGGGVSVGIILITKNTDATIGDNANVEGLGNDISGESVITGNIGDSSKTTAHGVIVAATSSETILHIVAAGGCGLFAGVAGAVGVSLINTTTDATIGLDAIINDFDPAAANKDQSVYVTAQDTFNLQAYIVGVAGGFVGLAGAVDVGTLTNDADAVIQGGALVDAKDNVEVNAVSTQSLTGYTISGSGGVAAIAASVSVWSLGGALDIAFADVTISGSVTASIGSATSIKSTGGVSVDATTPFLTANAQMIGGGGGLFSMSGMLSEPTINGTTAATIGSGGSITSAGLNVAANDEDTTATTTMGVVSAGVIGLTGVIAKATVDRNTKANVGTMTIAAAGNAVNIKATSVNNATANAKGFSAGAIEVSFQLADANISGEAQASIGAGSSVTGVLSVTANDTSTGTPTTTAVGIGLLTGNGSVAASTLNRTVEAFIGNATGTTNPASTFTLVGSATVNATSNETINVNSTGISLGLIAIGISNPTANIQGVTRAYIGPDTTVNATKGNVTLTANDTSHATVSSTAIAVGLATGGSVSPVATIARTADAFIDTAGGVNDPTGSVSIQATSKINASSSAPGGGGGGHQRRRDAADHDDHRRQLCLRGSGGHGRRQQPDNHVGWYLGAVGLGVHREYCLRRRIG